MTKRETFYDTITFTIFNIALFLIPVFFLPYTLNIINLSKQFLFYFFVAVLLFVWLVVQIIKKSFTFYRGPLDIPVVVFWVVYLFSTIFSSNRQESFFGNASAFSYSFMLHTAFTLFYFLASQIIGNSKEKIKTSINVLSLSLVISALYFIISKAGYGAAIIDRYVEFNTTATLNSLFGIAMVLPLTISILQLLTSELTRYTKVYNIFIFLISFIAIIGIGFKAIMIPMAISLAIVLLFAVKFANVVKYIWATVVFSALLVGLIFSFLNIPKAIRFDLPSEVSLGNKTSVQITKNALQRNSKTFILGEGPASFSRLFSLYRAAEFNALNPFWSFRFAQPRSTFLSILAESGILAGFAFAILLLIPLYFFVARLILSKKSDDALLNDPNNFYGVGLFSVFLALSSQVFFVSFQMVLWLVWWSMLVALAIYYKPEKPAYSSISVSLDESPQHSLGISFITVLVFITFLAFFTYLGRIYLAEATFASSLREPNLNQKQRIDLISKAIDYRSSYAPYRLQAAQIALDYARELSQSAKPPRDEITQLFSFSLSQARAATTIDPRNVETWQVLAIMYGQALGAAPDASQLAIEALDKAINLEPTNPIFYNQIANVYAFQGKDEMAEKNFKKAVELKPDLLLSYFNLSGFYLAKNKLDQAVLAIEAPFQFNQANPEYLQRLSEIYLIRNSSEDRIKAQLILEQITAANDKNIQAQLLLSKLYEDNGKKSDAIRILRLILKNQPDNKEVQNHLIELTRFQAPPPQPVNQE